MSWRRALVSILFTSVVAVLSVGTPTAQSLTNGSNATNTGTGVPVPISGIADAGAVLSGTFLVQRFAPQTTGVAASGTVTGVLTATDGSVRNLVFQATLPLDLTSSLARLNSDAALQGSCGALDVQLAGTQVNVLGTTIGLNPVGFDIASAVQAGTATSGTTATTAAAGSGASMTETLPTALSGNTTQLSPTPQFTTTVPTPGPTPTAPVASTAAQAQPTLGSLLCAVNGFRNASNLTLLVQQLNGIVTALSGSGS